MATDWQQLQAGFIRYRRGDAAAARQVFAAIRQVLVPFLRARAAVESEDLAQTCLLKIHFARDGYDERRPLKAWIFTIAVNTLKDHWRKQRLDVLAQSGDDPELADERLSEGLRLEYNDELRKALAALTPLDATLVYLVGVEQLSMAEAGTAVGLTENATKLRVSRGHAKLRGILGGAR